MTCRFCKLSEYDHSEPMHHYSTRHYAHISCGLNRFGDSFVLGMRTWMLGNLPYLILRQYGLLDAVRDRINSEA